MKQQQNGEQNEEDSGILMEYKRWFKFYLNDNNHVIMFYDYFYKLSLKYLPKII